MDYIPNTDADRARIRDAIRDDPAVCFLVTHGTDTIVETARALKGLHGKVIVLTGALQPARFRSSDAFFNIGCALAAVQTLPPGVYIAMNGRIFEGDSCRKNRETNRFEPL